MCTGKRSEADIAVQLPGPVAAEPARVDSQEMIRAYLAIAVWGLLLIMLGPPVLLIGFVYPSRRLVGFASAVWARVMSALCGMRLVIEGKKHIQDGEPIPAEEVAETSPTELLYRVREAIVRLFEAAELPCGRYRAFDGTGRNSG